MTKSLKVLDAARIQELKALAKPPQLVIDTMALLTVLIGFPGDSWKDC
jgi:rRNA-processing protein FCF1